MTTIFDNSLFSQSELFTQDGKNKIVCTLRSFDSSRYIADLVRNDSKGYLLGRMINPTTIPNWLVSGTILKGIVNDQKLILTCELVIQSRITKIRSILGDKIKFSYVAVSEFSS